MAHVAVVCSFSDFSDHVGHSIVIIGDIIIFFHGDADLFERIFRCGDGPQGGDDCWVSRIFAKKKSRLRFTAFSNMAVIAVFIR